LFELLDKVFVHRERLRLAILETIVSGPSVVFKDLYLAGQPGSVASPQAAEAAPVTDPRPVACGEG
jgi:hypothetical protein